MKSLQKGFPKTGGMHSASLMSTEGTIICFAEDIGRHNAVDKVIGKSLEYDNSNRLYFIAQWQMWLGHSC